MSVTTTAFPDVHLVPKHETQAWSFVQGSSSSTDTNHAPYDGRGVIVGILDTGVDPGAANLSTTSDGKPKVLDVVDCTGSGDVDVSYETTAQLVTPANGETSQEASYYAVTGLSGRPLRLSTTWTFVDFPKKETATTKTVDTAKEVTAETTTEASSTATVTVRLGLVRAYALYPSRLQSRVQADRQTVWEAAVAKYQKEVRHQLAALPTKSQDYDQQLQRDEWQARLDVLADKDWQSEDPGPLMDCIVYWDGTHYRAVVASDDYECREDAADSDTASTPIYLDLTKYAPLTSFAVERQYGTVGAVDQFHFAVQFYEEGRILSLVADASPHGTHVAGITAANDPTSAARCGVAPGAQIVSLKIGDSRLGSMETGTALTRALLEAVRQGCHVVNMSYGEGCKLPNSGRFIELANDLVWKHGITFVSSAGNNGPALTTVGAPGGTTTALLAIAAYVSPAMQQVLYSMPVEGDATAATEGESELETNDEIVSLPSANLYSSSGGPPERHIGSTYTWSSVGPTADGDWGVNLTAPGGAITSVSHWCLQKTQLMNGTSMSSPHAAGCVALLISACLAKGIPFSPTRIRRALMATASVLPGLTILQQGAGMIQVSRAWEYLQQFKDLETADVHLDVTIDNLSGSPRGVYLRQAPETCVPQTMAVRVDPTWRREDATTAKSQQCKIAFEAKFLLQSTVDWVKAPAHFMIMNNGRTFKMDVDPSGLKPGLHTAQVLGVDASCPEAGPLFAVPITVAKPLPESRSIDFGELSFGPAEMKRFFVVPPLGSTWMDIILTDTRSPDEEAFLKLYSLHTVQLLPHAAYRDFEEAKYYNLRPGQTVVATVAVEAGVTSEIDVGRYWSTLGPAAVKAQVAFRGIRPIPNQIQMVCGDAGALVRVNSDLADESLNPAAKLTKWWAPLRPKESPTVQPLGERDVLPSHNKQVYQLLLTYEFTQEDKGSFTPRVPTTQGVLYESGFESQMIMVYDGEKKLLGSADSWPSSISAPKGKVVLRMQIRHDSPEKLESLKDMPLWIERTLDKEISLSVYSSREAMVLGKATFRKRTLRRGCGAAVFFQEPAVSKLPSGYKTGDLLKGSYTLASGDASLVGDGKRPGGFPITYTVGPKPSKTSSDPDPPQPKDERTVEEKLSEAIRDLKVARLDELTSKEKEDGKFDILFGEFVKDYPKHLPLLMAKLRYLDTHAKRADKLTEILAAAEAVLVEISEDSLSLYFGKKADPNDADANKLKTEMKERKSFFVEALARSAMTYTQLTTADDAAAKFDAAFKRLQAWVDLDSDKQYTALYLEREKRAGRYGTVVKVLNKLLGKEVKEKDFMYPVTKAQLLEERTAALTKLGYTTLVDRDQKTRVVACPKSYALF